MIRRTSLEALLQQIANTLILNTGTVQKLGLLDGKMGIALFIYHYAQICENKNYRDFAVELLDEISRELSSDTISANFLYGLTGIGWSIRYLITKKFVDANEDVLEEVDESLKNINHSDVLTDIEKQCPFCSKGIYFLEKNNKKVIENIICVLNKELSKNTNVLPLSYWNSILYIILHENLDIDIYLNFLCIIYASMMNSIKNKHYTFPDVILLSNIIEQFRQIQNENINYKRWEELLEKLDYDELTGIFNMGIYKLIFNKLLIDDSYILCKLETMDIENQIHSMIKDVYRNLNLYNGLAGVGLTLCIYYSKVI